MTTPPPDQVCINPSQDPKTLKQCTQLTKQENDTCCFGEIVNVNVPICKTCAPNQMLYNGKCTDTTDLGCCFTSENTQDLFTGYYCDMKTGQNCKIQSQKLCEIHGLKGWGSTQAQAWVYCVIVCFTSRRRHKPGARVL